MTAMSIVAHCHPFVVGVDTHVRNHVYAILDATNGAMLCSSEKKDSMAALSPHCRRARLAYAASRLQR